MLRVFEDEQPFALRRESVKSQVPQESTPEELRLEKVEEEQVWERANIPNLNAALVLLSICRQFLPQLRAAKDAFLEAHILIRIAFALFATAHI